MSKLKDFKFMAIMTTIVVVLASLFLIIGMVAPVTDDWSGLKVSVSDGLGSGYNLFDMYSDFSLLNKNGLLIGSDLQFWSLIQLSVSGFAFFMVSIPMMIWTAICKFKG